MARPSPRTQGVDAQGNPFQKFGTQQLSYKDPTKPALGVVEKDVGKGWQSITTGGKVKGSGATTAFSQQFQSGITGIQRTVSRDVAIKMQDEKLRTMGIPTFSFSSLLHPIAGTILPSASAEEENGKTGECVEADPFCGFREFMEGKPAGTYCKCPNWFGWNGNGNGKERGCTECESCPPEKQAIGTCDCGIHCGIDPDTGKPKPPKPCPECPEGYDGIGSGSFLDPCRCVPPEDNPCTTECTTCDSDKCAECDAWDVPCETCRKKNGTCTPPEGCDLGCLLTARGCDCGCKDVKPCTTCDSDKCAECDAWDLKCEDCRTKDGTCTPPADPCGCLPMDWSCKIGCWWEKYGLYIMIIGGLIGLGIVLWLLRPLFSVIGSFKGGSP
jgi:hypothetical protein